MLMGHYQDAVKSFTAALENSPGIWSTHKQRAECFVRLGDYERALADLKASLEINPNDPTAALVDSAGPVGTVSGFVSQGTP